MVHGQSLRIPGAAAAAALLLLLLVPALAGAAPGPGAHAARRSRAARRLNLHRVDWSDVTLPGAACDGSVPIRLHDGAGLLTPVPRRWAGVHFFGRRAVSVGASSAPMAFGDLEGPGREAAALGVNCNDGGGTADSALLFSVVIFGARGGDLLPLGVLTPREQPPEVLPTLLSVTISRGRVSAFENFYGPADATCCSSGTARTIWTYSHGSLSAGTTVILKRPRAAPAA